MIFGLDISLNPRVTGKRHVLVSLVRCLRAPTILDTVDSGLTKVHTDYFDIKNNRKS